MPATEYVLSNWPQKEREGTVFASTTFIFHRRKVKVTPQHIA
jgi:hypothetical protein